MISKRAETHNFWFVWKYWYLVSCAYLNLRALEPWSWLEKGYLIYDWSSGFLSLCKLPTRSCLDFFLCLFIEVISTMIEVIVFLVCVSFLLTPLLGGFFSVYWYLWNSELKGIMKLISSQGLCSADWPISNWSHGNPSWNMFDIKILSCINWFVSSCLNLMDRYWFLIIWSLIYDILILLDFEFHLPH